LSAEDKVDRRLVWLCVVDAIQESLRLQAELGPFPPKK
jgi:hypothetical protein